MIARTVLILLGCLAVAVNLGQTLPGAAGSEGGPASRLESSLSSGLETGDFHFAYALNLTRGGSHRGKVFRHASRTCEVMVVAMDAPDEVLSLMRHRLTPESWARRVLWVAGSTYRVDRAWEVHWLRLRHRLAGDETGDGPYLLLPARTCPDDALTGIGAI